MRVVRAKARGAVDAAALADAAGCIGIFGGTFNPIHQGHVHAALAVREALGLKHVRLLPAANPPLKQGAEILAPAEARLAWVRVAAARYPQLRSDACEMERAQNGAAPSYTRDTLKALRARMREPLVFIIGQDAFAGLNEWRAPEEVLQLANFAVMQRPQKNAAPGALADWMPRELAAPYNFAADGKSARHQKTGMWIRRVQINALPISSTEVRRRMRAGGTASDLLGTDLARAVYASKIYGAPKAKP